MSGPVKGVGDVLLGRYVVERTWSNSAVVHLVRDREREGLAYIVKRMRPDIECHQPVVDWFLREGEIWRSVTGHPNIVEMLHPMRQDASDGSIYHFVEFVDGPNLAEVVRSSAEGRLAWLQALHWALRIADAMDHATRRARNGLGSFVHRDLEPSNIIVSRDGAPKIGDWGLACDLDRPEVPIPMFSIQDLRGPAVGKPRWMPPELFPPIRGRTYGIAGDIYSFGGTLLFMLTGVTPNPKKAKALRRHEHTAGEVTRTLADHQLGEVRQALEACSAPAELVDVVLHCLSLDEGDRPGTFSEVRRALEGVRGARAPWRGYRCHQCELLSNTKQDTCPVCASAASAWRPCRYQRLRRPRPEHMADTRGRAAAPSRGARTLSYWVGGAAVLLVIALFLRALEHSASGTTTGRVPEPDLGSEPIVQVPVGFELVKAWPDEGDSSQLSGPRPPGHWAWKIRCEATGIVLLFVEPGSFEMGSIPGSPGAGKHDLARHPVDLAHPYYLSETEVTRAQWQRGIAAKRDQLADLRHRFADRIDLTLVPCAENDARPVSMVRWVECEAFCSILGLRLPTEAEWEYACRAGSSTTYSFGDDSGDLVEFGWHRTNSAKPGSYSPELQPVLQLKANAWGFHGMHGGLWEWCADGSSELVSRLTVMEDRIDPRGGPTGMRPTDRVTRGGCYAQGFDVCRSAGRSWESAWRRTELIGFRVAMSIPAP